MALESELEPEIAIRRARSGDERALSIVGQATFLETFAGILDGQDIVAHCLVAHASERYRVWLDDTKYALWIAEHAPAAAPVGYAVFSPPDLPVRDPSPFDVELKRIYVLSKFHGAGIGKRLLSAVRDHARQAGARRLLLGVYADNRNAIAFYQRSGFMSIGTRQFLVGTHTYSDTVMAHPLD